MSKYETKYSMIRDKITLKLKRLTLKNRIFNPNVRLKAATYYFLQHHFTESEKKALKRKEKATGKSSKEVLLSWANTLPPQYDVDWAKERINRYEESKNDKSWLAYFNSSDYEKSELKFAKEILKLELKEQKIAKLRKNVSRKREDFKEAWLKRHQN